MSRSRAVASALWFALLGVHLLHAQTPITALPRPAGDTSLQDPASPALQQQPASAPNDSVHPITSLPKPPGVTSLQPAQPSSANPAEAPAAPSYTSSGYASPNAPPLPAVDAVPSTSPTVQPATALSPASGATPAGGAAYVLPHSSSSAPTAAPPAPTPVLDAPMRASAPQDPVIVTHAPARIRPFSTFAIQFKVGTAGIGFDAAVPLAQHFDLRGGGSIFSYSGSYDDSGDDITGAAQFRSGEFYIDYYPFRHGALRISGGVVLNYNYLNATTLVGPGQPFDLDSATYYSSATDPVHGTASFNFGRKVAPSFTIGFGSMIPRTGKHVSFPFEVGFMYVADPSLSLTLVGTVCDTSTPPNCEKIDNDPVAQGDLQQEVTNINADIHFLRFYPILSQGISIKF